MNGQTLIIENIGEEIDPTLDPVLARAIYKKGRYVSTNLTPYTCSHKYLGGIHARVSDEEYSLTKPNFNVVFSFGVGADDALAFAYVSLSAALY